MAKSTTMLLFALMLVPFLLANEDYEYEPGINVSFKYIVDVKQSGKHQKLDLAFNNVKPKDWFFVLD